MYGVPRRLKKQKDVDLEKHMRGRLNIRNIEPWGN